MMENAAPPEKTAAELATATPARPLDRDMEIVAHCWLYDRLLSYQLSSILHHPPTIGAKVAFVLYHASRAEDGPTHDAIEFFGPRLREVGVELESREVDRGRLLRRAIGRNHASFACRARWLWFADCDYMFGPDCLNEIIAAVDRLHSRWRIAFPRTTLQTEQPGGDALIAAAADAGLRVRDMPDPRLLEPARNKVAIGGIQIARGAYVRQAGYLPHDEILQKPVGEGERWKRTYEDRGFRIQAGTRGRPIDVPNLIRIRHSDRGRFTAGLRL